MHGVASEALDVDAHGEHDVAIEAVVVPDLENALVLEVLLEVE